MIINGALGGQYILNWMGNQEKFAGNKPVGISPGVMTWLREISKLVWAVTAVSIEILNGKKLKYQCPGIITLTTIIICGFTRVIENIDFFYLPKYYSHHLYAPYVNDYLVMLPFIMMFFDKNVTGYQIAGAVVATAGFMVGVSDYSRYKVEEIKNTCK